MSASYPGGVKTFTPRSAGQTIDPSHVNDLQDEVNAVESGLINGLAHDLKFTDATYDIGKSGATRPRDIFASRDVTVGRSLDLSGAAAGQVVFPSAQNASSGANTLDDYEEGTWTPVLGGLGGTSGQTYSLQAGRYVKVGRLVTCWGRVTLTAKGTITGNLQIQGLPFTPTTAADSAVGDMLVQYWLNMSTSWCALHGNVFSNATNVEVYGAKTAAATSITTLTGADVSNSTDWIFRITYLAAA